MASKDATVYVIDIGESMGECRNGRIETDLEYGMRYVWEKIASTMSANKKTSKVGIVAFRSDGTDNPLSDGEGYENISVLKTMGEPIQMSHLPYLREKIAPSKTNGGDAISAIVVAIEMIKEATELKSGKPGKYDRKIALITSAEGSMDDMDVESICEQIKTSGIELVVVGIDFDAPDYGYKQEDKSPLKEMNEKILFKLSEGCDGHFGTAAEVMEDISIPAIKRVRDYATYTGRLALGDFVRYPETAMYIDVKRYTRTKVAKPVSATSFAVHTTNAESSNTISGDTEMPDAPAGDDLVAIRRSVTYTVNDPSAAGGKKHLDITDMAKGYSYGRTAVPFSDLEEGITKLHAKQDFSIIGFIPNEGYEKYFNMGESCVTVAQDVNDKARMALSSFIHALHELESYAVARIVPKDDKDPQIILLAPYIEPNFEALVDIRLPFAEDVRIYRFPPLDKVVTPSGSSLEKHRNIPSEDLESAMGEYVDSMDLSTFGKDDDGNASEYMPVADRYSPMVHRINQIIRQRAMYPDEPIGPPSDFLTKWSIPPADLVKESDPQLQKLIEVADVKKVPEKAKARRERQQETTKPLSGLDVNSLLNREKRHKISNENAIPEFKQMVNSAKEDNAIKDAIDQMSKIIKELITKSNVGDTGYAQAQEQTQVMRAESINYEMWKEYNDFIRDFKERMVNGELGGDRREFWFNLKNAKLGLIDQDTLDQSDVSGKEAREFWYLRSDLPTRSK